MPSGDANARTHTHQIFVREYLARLLSRRVSNTASIGKVAPCDKCRFKANAMTCESRSSVFSLKMQQRRVAPPQRCRLEQISAISRCYGCDSWPKNGCRAHRGPVRNIPQVKTGNRDLLISAHLKFTSKGSENPPLKNGRMELARPKTDIKLGRRVWSLPKPKLAEHGDDLDPVAALKFQVKRYLLRATHLVLPLHSMKSSLNLSGDSSCVVAMDVSHASNSFGALGFV